VKPETYSELGKSSLNIAVGLVIVGILQPYLSKKATLQGSSLIAYSDEDCHQFRSMVATYSGMIATP